MQLKRYISILLTFLLLLVAGSASAQLDASALMRGQRNAARGGNSLTGMQNGLGGMGADPNAMGVDGQNGGEAQLADDLHQRASGV